ncbi:unnamed protein product [Adineta steineri]|uniref:CDC20/Fizzy WD40 domain-containing protein n=1 Tax=Adineta steineri TaxID=433720 RepID=A0A814SHV0_9BILA|nr:unnamed protein product [Adineta steineri]CAF1147543.1 unnamed protein product [Adineta steineri]CAF1155844.1 unnamed protein product [Adineta steineri]
MDAQFERRLLFSMSGQSSLQSLSPFKSPLQSPVKTSDRYIPFRSSLSISNLHYQLNTQTSVSPNQQCPSSSASPSNTTTSPNKKRKYEQNQIGLGSGITANEPDLAIYRQLLQNTLLNTNVDSILKISDVQNTNQENAKIVTPKKCLINKENSSVSSSSTPIFHYSERAENCLPTSTFINKHHFTRSPMSNASVHLLYSPKKTIRRIPKVPFKVLDAPDLHDDFYLNLIDWSSSNVLSVGLGACVYLCNAQTNNVQLLCDLTHTQLPSGSSNQSNIIGSDSVTSVAWADWSNILAVGTNKGHVHIYDVTTQKRLQSICKHTSRVGTLAWNDWTLCSGSRDRSIIEHEIRAQSAAHIFRGHTQEVCGLKWSPDKSILASGGNDNRLFLWSKSQPTQPLHSFDDHLAAVKAIAWSPHQHGLMASGGGTADRHIRFRSSLTCQTLSVCDTGSQVCQLVWSKNSPNELASTHGYSQNQIVVWKYPTMQPLAKLFGHQQRVLYLAMSPDGESIVTGAGDETLRFWNVFAKAKCIRNPDSKLNGLNRMR